MRKAFSVDGWHKFCLKVAAGRNDTETPICRFVFDEFLLLLSKNSFIMKKAILCFVAAASLWMQPLMASSSHEGGEKNHKKEMQSPGGQASLGEAGPSAGMPTAVQADAGVTTTAASTSTEVVRIEDHATDTKVVAKSHHKTQPLKVLREARQHEGGGPTFGILSLVLGLLGFIFGWVLWPVGLLFAVLAIVFGAIGMSGGRRGKGMAIAGLIFGILTIVLPVLIVALIIAAFA